MQELLVATSNPGKFKEIVCVLDGAPFEFLSLADLGLSSEGLKEDGETFEENAFKKAKFFADKSGMVTLAEDSGLMVDALEGELGVKTRRWGAGEAASDEEWLEYFMERMLGVPEDNRGARFVCSACLIDEKSEIEKYFEGETLGMITKEVMAPILRGLPLSSCFQANGFDRVYAALTTEEKGEVSHRGWAISKVKEFLEKELI